MYPYFSGHYFKWHQTLSSIIDIVGLYFTSWGLWQVGTICSLLQTYKNFILVSPFDVSVKYQGDNCFLYVYTSPKHLLCPELMLMYYDDQ